MFVCVCACVTKDIKINGLQFSGKPFFVPGLVLGYFKEF